MLDAALRRSFGVKLSTASDGSGSRLGRHDLAARGEARFEVALRPTRSPNFLSLTWVAARSAGW